MLVPHQEVAAANAEDVRPMEGTAICPLTSFAALLHSDLWCGSAMCRLGT
jgi:hypothetical protein